MNGNCGNGFPHLPSSCTEEETNPKNIFRSKSPPDEAYASLSRGTISETDDSNCENLNIQFRASSTPRQISVSHSRLKFLGNRPKSLVEHDLHLGIKPEGLHDPRRFANLSNFTLVEETISSGFNGDNSLDLCLPEKCNNSMPKSNSLLLDQQSDLQPLDLRMYKTKPCTCTKSPPSSSSTINSTPFDIRTLLNCNQDSTSMPLIPQTMDRIPNANFPNPCSNMILQAMTEFFILMQQQQQKSTLHPSPSQLPIEPRWPSQQLQPFPFNSLTSANPLDRDSQLQEPGFTNSQFLIRTPTSNPQPTEFGSQMNHEVKSQWDLANSESDRVRTRPFNAQDQDYCVSNSSDSIVESREEFKSEDNGENELANKGPAIIYHPEPEDSKEKIRRMIEQNDPRIKYVNDGAAIRNPFAVDRKTQLTHLTALLCVKLDNNCYLCKGCNRTTSRLRPMQQHLLSHSSSKFNLCVRCLKGFNDKYDMKRHTRKHTLVRPYVCPECNRSFSQRCSLEGHRRKIHKIKLDYTPNQRREVVRVCESCGYACSRLVDMVSHTVTYHPSSTSLARLRRQLSRHEDRIKRNQKNSSNLKVFTNLLNTHE